MRRPRPYALKRLAVDFENFDRSAGRSVIKDADYKRPVYHANVSRLVLFFLKIGPCAC